MDRELANKLYREEYIPLKKEFEVLLLSGDKRVIKECRQRLSALSLKYADRHYVEPLKSANGEFLLWVADRLVRHGENPNVDYMRRLRDLAGEIE